MPHTIIMATSRLFLHSSNLMSKGGENCWHNFDNNNLVVATCEGLLLSKFPRAHWLSGLTIQPLPLRSRSRLPLQLLEK